MTNGQERAILELKRLNASNPVAFELVHEPLLIRDLLVATVGLRLGLIETSEGGLNLREREEFIVLIPPDFPFDCPDVKVAHTRFAGFPHVIWGKWICLYQSDIEWIPSDGLYGFFDRLRLWLEKAAVNQMDPIEGPLEPPHYDTDFSQKPFLVRADAPCAPGESWIGLAVLERHPNRTDLVDWNDLSREWPQKGQPAFAVILPNALPMEFPTNGAELFRDLERAGMGRESILRNLGLAALLSPDGEPIYLVIGLPMRRAADGAQRLHIAVWAVNSECAKSLRHVLPENTDTQAMRGIRRELSEAIAKVFEMSDIKWCKVLENRAEIIVRRDKETLVAWFARKNILILGCGALGSWIAEMVARAKPNAIHLVDNAFVKPGVLARQNFELQDIGANKAEALARRLRAIGDTSDIVAHNREAHAFILENATRFRDYDVVLDCTASSIFEMKLERDWARFSGHTPPFISLVLDAQARHALCVVIQRDSSGGLWDGYLSLKRRLCIDRKSPDIVMAFYSERAMEKMFQPEPGCSDPTFVGSTADVAGLASGALNLACRRFVSGQCSAGIALSAPDPAGHGSALECVELPQFLETVAGQYRVRIALSAFDRAKAWVKKNNQSRSRSHETGGLLWGVWDDAVQVIWVFDLSGPPPDSQHDPAHFICGVKGTLEEHQRQMARTCGTCGFVGYWHTHPDLISQQSPTDMVTMAKLVSTIGQNQKRSVMLIFGRTPGMATAGVYVYESQTSVGTLDTISMGVSQVTLPVPVV